MSLGEKTKPTRTELRKINNETGLAKSGHELLKLKNDAMLIKITDINKEIKIHNKTLEENTAKARNNLFKAFSTHGITKTKYLAASVKENKNIKIEKKRIMGVKLNSITTKGFDRKLNERGYNLRDSSIDIDRTADSFEKLMPQLLKSGEMRSNINLLKKEIKKTNRKTNALKKVIIPRLLKDKNSILSKLEEKSREDFIRTKLTKNRK